jgi:hypothetical protein
MTVTRRDFLKLSGMGGLALTAYSVGLPRLGHVLAQVDAIGKEMPFTIPYTLEEGVFIPMPTATATLIPTFTTTPIPTSAPEPTRTPDPIPVYPSYYPLMEK